MHTPPDGAPWNLAPGRHVMRKLPHITALFWAIKILATTLGETLGDFVSQDLGLGTLRAAVLLLGVFAVLAVIQVRANRFHPPLFWLVVVLTSTAGTAISDFINYTRHLGQSTGVLILGTGLAVVTVIWWAAARPSTSRTWPPALRRCCSGSRSYSPTAWAPRPETGWPALWESGRRWRS